MRPSVLRTLYTLAIAFALSSSRAPCQEQPGQCTLKIFVDEGKGSANGHVFIALSDGRKTDTLGFYSESKSLALFKLGGGEVRDDSKSPYDVARTFYISEAQYKAAWQTINEWRKEDSGWSVNHHCGDFAETVARAAGVQLNLSWQKTGRNRPGLFKGTLLNDAAAVSASIVGTWERVNGPNTVWTFEPDGKASGGDSVHPSCSGRWERTGPDKYTVRWNHSPPGKPPFVDYLEVTGTRFEGQNNFGDRVEAKKSGQ